MIYIVHNKFSHTNSTSCYIRHEIQVSENISTVLQEKKVLQEADGIFIKTAAPIQKSEYKWKNTSDKIKDVIIPKFEIDSGI